MSGVQSDIGEYVETVVEGGWEEVIEVGVNVGGGCVGLGPHNCQAGMSTVPRDGRVGRNEDVGSVVL